MTTKKRQPCRPRHGPTIAEREYQLVTTEGVRSVRLRLGEPLPDGDDACCFYQIDGLEPDGPIIRWVMGVDGVQALQLAMQLAATELMSTGAYDAGRLTFYGSFDLGLPVPENVAHLVRKDPEPG